eukprot:CAMPEP_0171932058 /NCGR_PEP_ID=MMETSP0993-20121228/30022_1 /TAXON_ID=483369 /ORGANISM="non described non described, Strain CCMP2098" /LENGTH=68 /DNA_ID=CAMNT_0012572241 /DNA_START=685 /DNA_END=891 /DNA_ORIENTATION=-
MLIVKDIEKRGGKGADVATRMPPSVFNACRKYSYPCGVLRALAQDGSEGSRGQRGEGAFALLVDLIEC